ncbi:MAG: MMPL family transporter, partial [Bacteroidia bacterium]
MQSWPWLIYLFFSKRRIVFTVLVLAVCGGLGYYASKIKLEEDISRFVPKDKNSSDINTILGNLKSKDKLVVHISTADPAQVETMVETADRIFDTIQRHAPKDSYTGITYKIAENTMQQVYEVFYRNLPLFLTPADYARIGTMTAADSIAFTLKKDYETLLSPSGIVLSKFITRDPLNIVPLTLKKLENIQIDENFEVYNGAIVTKDHRHLLLFITPAWSANEAAKNKPLIDLVKAAAVKYKSNGINIEPFGACMVALDNAEQIRKDSMTTTAIAVILIALLIGIYFKNPLPVIFILLPVGFGMVFSLALLYILKGVVSAIAVGAGAVVLGIAINYSLHFFTHYKHTRSVKA